MTIWNMATIFVLSFLGLMMVALMLFFLWLAYRYDITFSIKTRDDSKGKDKGKITEPTKKAG